MERDHPDGESRHSDDRNQPAHPKPYELPLWLKMSEAIRTVVVIVHFILSI